MSRSSKPTPTTELNHQQLSAVQGGTILPDFYRGLLIQPRIPNKVWKQILEAVRGVAASY